MSVRTKNRRKITVKGILYIWYIEMGHDSQYYLLNIISEDKNLVLSVPLHTKTPYIISKGNMFQNAKTNGLWNRYLLPIVIPDIITPKTVSDIIKWAVSETDAVIVKWNGKDIPV